MAPYDTADLKNSIYDGVFANIFAILHIVGGGFWAGINLCMNNLLVKKFGFQKIEMSSIV